MDGMGKDCGEAFADRKGSGKGNIKAFALN
jgi:hypothetical protein